MSRPVQAVIVAAGMGTRLGSSTAGGSGPKALRRIRGKSLCWLSVRACAEAGVRDVIVVAPAGHEAAFVEELRDLPVSLRVVHGGSRRQDSVAAGVALTSEAAIVLVHDAARPLVPGEVIRRVIDVVDAGAAVVIPAIAVTDSLREVTPAGSTVVDRSALRAIQTPQGFDGRVLQHAHAQVHDREYTDDAALCEAYGAAVTLVEGSPRSMKVTNPLDFALAEALMTQEDQ